MQGKLNPEFNYHAGVRFFFSLDDDDLPEPEEEEEFIVMA